MTGPIEPEWAMVSILFADIRDFTTFADRGTAREAADFLGAFFSVIVPVVTRHGGHANKLLGDGLLAVFGAPERHDDHADRALAAAEEMLAAVEREFGDRCRIGVGINSGLVLAGTIGGGGLTEYGVVGDPVNVASRVQDATRDLGEPLLLTEATHCLLEHPDGRLSRRGDIALKGKDRRVGIYGLQSRNAAGTVDA